MGLHCRTKGVTALHRFFIDNREPIGAEIVLTGENAAHMERVLRMRAGEQFVACDGRGTDYMCALTRFENKTAVAEVLSFAPNMAEPPAPLVLFQGLPKADKMELILQKAVELGATEIVPVTMERCIVKLSGKETAKVERWQKIAESAAKQSGRGCIPKVAMPVTLTESSDLAQRLGCCAVAYENEKTQLLRTFLDMNASEAKNGFGIFIGPEGGFEPAEIEQLAGAGIASVSLGKRILRTETAGLYALAAVGTVWEW